MAERDVFWRIVTNFSRARKDADKLAESLERVEAAREDLDEGSVKGNKDAEATGRKRNKVIEEMARQSRVASKAQKEANKATDDSVAGTHRATKAATERSFAEKKAAQELKRLSDVEKKALPVTEALAKAREKVTNANLAQRRSAAALEAAESRLMAVEAKHGTASTQHANALLSVKRRQLEVESSTNRYTDSLKRLEGVERNAAASSDRHGGSLNRLQTMFARLFSGGSKVPGMLAGIAMGIVKLGAVAALAAGGIGGLVAGLSALTAGATALVGPLLSVASAAAAIPQAFTVAAGAVGTFIAAFQGVGDALSQGIKMQQGAAKSSRDLAKQERTSARGIIQAQRGVRNAREAAAESAKQNARAVRDSRAQVVAAENAMQEATENVSRARRDAVTQIRDLQNALKDLELQERGAALSVEEAQRRLQETLIDPTADTLAKDQAQLAYDEAINNLQNVKKEHSQAAKDAAEAKKKGVKGNDIVVSALEAEKQATLSLRDAKEQLADAEKNRAKSARDSKEAIGDAKAALAEARATRQEMALGTTEMQNFQQAMENLSPAQRDFVNRLLGMRDEMKRLKEAAAEGLLPGLGDALTTMLKLVPLAEKGLRQFGQTMGRTAQRGAKMLTSKRFMPMWNRLLESNNKLLGMAGDAMLNLVEAVVYLMDAARPFTEWLGRTVLGWTEYWKTIARSGNETGKTAKKLDEVKTVLKLLGSSLKNVWKFFKGVGRAGKDLGFDLLRSFKRITKGWSDWSNSVRGQKELKEWFDNARPTLHEFSLLLGSLTRAFFDLGREHSIAPVIKAIRTKLGPAIGDLIDAMDKSDIGLKIVDALTAITDALTTIVESGGGEALGALVDTLGFLAEVISHIPPPVLAALGVFIGTLAAVRFVGFITGISGAIGFIKKLIDWKKKANAVPLNGGQVTGAGGTTGAAGAAGKGGAHKGTKGGKLRQKLSAPRGEGGFLNVAGGGRKGGAHKTADPGKTMAKAGSGARKAAGGIGVLTLALSFLPGKLGEIAGKISTFLLVLSLFGPMLGKIGGFFLKFMSVVGKVVMGIGGLLIKLAGYVGKALLLISRALLANPFMLLIAGLILVVFLVVKYWDKIKAAVVKGVEAIWTWIKKNWKIIKWFLGPVVLLIDYLVRHWGDIKKIFEKGFNFILNLAKTVWKGVTKLFIDPIKSAFRLLGVLFGDIKAGFSTLWRDIKKGASLFKGAFGTIWDGIKEIFKAPIRFIINTVLEKGILGVIRKVSKFVGFDAGADLHVGLPEGFAKGGIPSSRNMSVYPGYTPGKDVGVIGISGGEAIMRPEWTRAVGKKRIDEMNLAARTGKYAGGFAKGGIPAVGTWSRHASGYSFPAYDINVPGQGDYGNPVRAYAPGKVEGVTYLGDRSYGRYITIDHGSFKTLYAHLSAASVRAGQEVLKGQQIGNVGDLGNATGAHLHFEIRGEGAPSPDTSGGGGGLNLPGWLKKIMGNVAGYVRGKINGGIDALTGKFGDNGMIKMMSGLPKKMVNGVADWITGKTNAFKESQALAQGAANLTTTGLNLSGKGANVDIVHQAMRNAGFGEKHWGALQQLVSHESGFNNMAQNPTSTAFGMFQFLDSTWGSVGGSKTSDPALQALYGLRYVKNRYGNPTSAWAFWERNHYYNKGGVVPGFADGGTVPGVGSGDTVPAMLTPGEFVMNKNAVNQIGLANLHSMNRSYGRKPGAMRNGIQRFAKGGVVRSGSFNAHTYGHSPAKTINDLKKILPKVDSLALQEWTNAAGSAQSFLKKQGFGLYRGPTGTAIAWRKSRFSASQFGNYDLNKKYRMPKGTSQRYATYGMLTDRETGQKFWQGSAHLIPGAGYFKGRVSKQKRDAIFHEQQNRIADLVKRLGKSAPVIMGGDYNDRSNGLVKGLSSNKTNKIDQIYSGLKAQSTSVVSTKKLASDHSAIMSTYNLSGKKGGAAATSTKNAPATATGVGPVTATHPASGSVLGMKKGAKGEWVKGLQRLVGQKMTGVWDTKLDTVLRRRGNRLWVKGRKPQTQYGALNKRMGLASQKNSFNTYSQKALTHVLAHAFGRNHDPFAYRPWQYWTPLEASIISQQNSNVQKQKWQDALVTLSGWGYTDLLADLQGKGVEDGLKIAEEAAKNKVLAQRLNAQLKIANSISDEDFSRMISMLGYMNSSAAGVGLRDVARHLGISDYETVKLWENAGAAGRLTKLTSARSSRMKSDVKSWRGGTFYAAEGGVVPGSGTGDTVPAMLTPGEFVIKKKAAEALGLNNLFALNGLQKFAGGGLVMNPGVSAIPTKVTTGVASRRLGGNGREVNYNYTWDVDINNPVAEPGTRSMLKLLQRQSALGKSSPNNGKSA